MHVVDLGVCARFVGVAVRRLLDSGAYGPTENSLRAWLNDLQEYYKHRERQGFKCSKVGKGFSEKQLGKPQRPFFKGRAAEARHMVPFVVECIRRHHLRIQPHGTALLEAGCALLRVYRAQRRDVRLLPEKRCRELWHATCQFLLAWSRAGGHRTIKHHYMVHWARQCVDHGNPSFYHTYADENFHRRVKRVAQRVHATRFAEHTLARLKRARMTGCYNDV
jgi:hypothetical protein